MEQSEQDKSRRKSWSIAALVVTGALAAATVFACFTVLDPPDAVTEEAQDIKSLYYIVLALAVVVFVGVEGLIIWAAFRYRRVSDDEPPQVHGNNKLEFGWTAIPIVILGILFVLATPLVIDLREPLDAGEADLVVDVTGRQWFWDYEYPDQGITIQEAPDYENPDPPALVVPLGARIQLNIQSADVIHSFYVKEFLYKIFAVPGQINRMHFTPTEVGRFEGQCAQFCGLNHAQMLLVVEVMEQEDFDAWVAEQQAEQEEEETPEETPAEGEETPEDEGGSGEQLEITATDNEYSTQELTAAAGEISVELTNDGDTLHNFAIPDEDVAAELISGGESTTVTFTIEEAGEYDYRCDVHPEEMQGTLVVE